MRNNNTQCLLNIGSLEVNYTPRNVKFSFIKICCEYRSLIKHHNLKNDATKLILVSSSDQFWIRYQCYSFFDKFHLRFPCESDLRLAHFLFIQSKGETYRKKKHFLKQNNHGIFHILIRLRFQGYRCKSGISVFAPSLEIRLLSL